MAGRLFDAEAPAGAAAMAATLTLAVCILLMAAPRPFGPIPTPFFPVIAVYYWTLTRPAVMPPPAVFAGGLVLDLLTWTPLGFWALGLLAASGASRLMRPYLVGASVWRRLAGMAGAMAAASAAGVIALGAADRDVTGGWLQLVQLFLTVLIYPVVEAGLSALLRSAGLGRG